MKNREKNNFKVGDAVPVIIEHLCKYSRMSIEEILIQYRIVVCKCFGEPRQSGRGNFLECRLVRLVPDAAYVQNDAILSIHRVSASSSWFASCPSFASTFHHTTTKPCQSNKIYYSTDNTKSIDNLRRTPTILFIVSIVSRLGRHNYLQFVLSARFRFIQLNSIS